jgi:signal recognition particle subunit SRP19
MSYQNNQQTAGQSRAAIKTHCTLYPLYFDSTRTRSSGRRVTRSLAIPNPLAYSLLLALRHILSTTSPHTPLQLTLEPDKTHPKDWANPGRVRIRLFSDVEDGHKPLHPSIPNKARLYTLVGQYLKDNPTRKEDPLELKIPGLPVPENFLAEDGEVKAPRGWKMGKILPVHSAAVSGGGVSENFFKEAMEEMKAMQGQGSPAGLPQGGGGMPDMAQLQQMMGQMGGMGGLANMMGGGGGGGGGGAVEGGKKGKGKKK